MRQPDYLNLPQLVDLHDAIRSLDPAAHPSALTIYPSKESSVPGARVAVLPGSFNPLHQAHLALATAALAAGPADQVWFGVARVTVDKEQIEGVLLEDRLIALTHLAEQHSEYGVLLLNRGLYVDQAQAIHSMWPGLNSVLFLVGYDKIEQILDPRYYTNRDGSLHRLFDLASFLVAPRDGAKMDDLHALLARPENRRFADRVLGLPLPNWAAAVSSTQLRKSLADVTKQNGCTPLTVPTARLVEDTHAYKPPVKLADEWVDFYGIRAALLTVSFNHPEVIHSRSNLRLLLDVLLEPTRSGRALRSVLMRSLGSGSTADELMALGRIVRAAEDKYPFST